MLPPNQQEFIAQLNFQLPQDYLAYLFNADPTDNFGAAFLVEADELLQFNADYEAAMYYAGYFLIGGQDGEALAIEKATGYFVATPFIGHDEETPIILGRTWAEFTNRLKAGTLFDSE